MKINKLFTLKMYTISIDDDNFAVNSLDQTIYQFLYTHDKVQPCFCYHEKLTIAGNCRMCLVEANGALVVSCAMPLLNNMKISTTVARVRHARESVMEFLLINHPLDCPVCDQGGECDLQDIGRAFGIDRGRYYENKRSVDNLTCFGPMIKTVMTRCIHCTRCVRFLNEYCDEYKLGVLGRGANMEIGTYVNTFIWHELCGNIIDICPVGALTSMPYAFTARPWELNFVETIDILDSMASTIRVEITNNKVQRTLPVLTENLNEDWITNKTRFTFDAYNTQRLYYPYYQDYNSNISWFKAVRELIEIFIRSEPIWKMRRVVIKLGNYIDLETGYGLKTFFNSIGCNNISYQKTNVKSLNDWRNNYLLDNKVVDFENFDFIIFMGVNLRLDNPLLNSRLRKNYLRNSLIKFYSIGYSLTYSSFPVTNLGNNIKSLLKFISYKLPKIKNLISFKGLQNLNFLKSSYLNGTILLKKDLQILKPLLEKTKLTINIFSETLGKITSDECGFNSNVSKIDYGLLYNIGTEPENVEAPYRYPYIVYQGSFKPANARLILPTAFFTEKSSTYMNFEGKIKLAKLAITPYKTLLTDLEVFRLLNIILIKTSDNRFTTINNFEHHILMFENLLLYTHIFFKNLDQFFKSFIRHSGFFLKEIGILTLFKINSVINNKLLLKNNFINREGFNYYNKDTISKLSKTMSICAKKISHSNFNV